MAATKATTAAAKRNTSLSVVPLAARWWSKKFMTARRSELDLRGVPHLGALRWDLQQRCGSKVEHARIQRARKGLPLVVVVHHRVVVGLPRERDPVLRRGQLLGELHHGLARLQVGILLDDHIEPAQRAVQRLLAGRQLL